ncbi:MAG: DUF1549 and DUF1553 domain-containing protein [Pirellulaceae bacterium]
MGSSSSQAEDSPREPNSFTNDVLPLLSKHGCNSGQCHGKAIGQNGFKLSLYGFDPAADYAALVHESRGRRVSPAAPEQSLLLLKATGSLAHGGGVRFETGSPHYQRLRQWIIAGTPWGEDGDPVVTSIEVDPVETVVEGATEVSLRVTAVYSDDSRRDVTDAARYDAETPQLLDVDSRGVVASNGASGEGLVMIRYRGQAATARVTTPYGKPLPDDVYSGFQAKNFIDELALAKWRKLGVAPSNAADDAMFLRRVYLDTLGVLPTPEEVRAFVADGAADKRDKLIDRLLERDEFADLWTHRWGEVLRNKVGDSNFKDHTVAFADWIRQSIKQNKPYDQFVREIITVSGQRKDHPQMDWYRQAINNQVRVEDTCQVFLGMRVSCANCHNHPFENISQNDYWSLAAFFARVGSKSYGSIDEIKLDEKGKVVHPRTDEEMQPRAFGGEAYEYVAGEDPREKLMDWMTAPENPYFARAICNRIWGHYMKVGLVDPVDDMRATNPPSNPELLDALAKELVEHRYDLKHLMRLILTSRVYGLSSDPTEQNSADSRNYARHYPRRLSPHVLMDAVASATGVPDEFKDYPNVKRAVQLPNEKARSDFLDVFGRSNRDTPCECETSLEPNLGQVLFLLHSEELQRKLHDDKGVVAQLAKDEAPTEQAVETLYLRSFSRRPTDDERALAVQVIDQAEDKRLALEDLLWSLLNSSEFVFNH